MSEHTSGSLESALAAMELELDTAIKAAGVALRQLKKGRTAAQGGSLRDMERALEASAQSLAELAEKAQALRDSFDFDAEAHMEGGAYLQEVLEAASAEGLQIYEQDGLLYSFPCLVRLLPSEQAVRIDKAKDRKIRPSALVRTLKHLQEKPLRFRGEHFIESLYNAYTMVRSSEGEVITLQTLYRLLTLLPGQTREYPFQEFARDLYLLDLSGLNTTKSGHLMRLPASTGTRQPRGTIRVIARDGSEKKYYGISFRQS